MITFEQALQVRRGDIVYTADYNPRTRRVHLHKRKVLRVYVYKRKREVQIHACMCDMYVGPRGSQWLYLGVTSEPKQ